MNSIKIYGKWQSKVSQRLNAQVTAELRSIGTIAVEPFNDSVFSDFVSRTRRTKDVMSLVENSKVSKDDLITTYTIDCDYQLSVMRNVIFLETVEVSNACIESGNTQELTEDIQELFSLVNRLASVDLGEKSA